MNLSRMLRTHWRTLAGAALGAALGAAYAQLIGCRTGTCPLTGNVWTAAAFFGFTGAMVGLPGPRRQVEARDVARQPRGRAGSP